MGGLAELNRKEIGLRFCGEGWVTLPEDGSLNFNDGLRRVIFVKKRFKRALGAACAALLLR